MKYTGIILAGGRSSRFGSDKAIFEFQGKTMLKHSIDLLRPFCDRILISGDREEYFIYDYPCVPDRYKDAGPMGGICSCLEESETELNLVITVDMPLVTRDMIARLVMNHQMGGVTIFDPSMGAPYPFPGVYQHLHLPLFKEFIRKSSLDLNLLLKRLEVHRVSLMSDESPCLANVNTKEQLVALDPACVDD